MNGGKSAEDVFVILDMIGDRYKALKGIKFKALTMYIGLKEGSYEWLKIYDTLRDGYGDGIDYAFMLLDGLKYSDTDNVAHLALVLLFNEWLEEGVMLDSALLQKSAETKNTNKWDMLTKMYTEHLDEEPVTFPMTTPRRA